ncbi:MAG: dTMP kinase [Ruminococcaceae bacterium]|nr:dTMP kinase [Oscillospiraceae bacterium]
MSENSISRGRFIVFEGLDGSGKSTQMNLLCERLQREGRKVYRTAEPTELTTGGLIRDALAGNYVRTPEELSALFLSDRIAHNVNSQNGIIKLLNDGYDVVCDRYYYSSFAYQGMDSDLDWVMAMNVNCPTVTKPDVCFFIDVPSDVCKGRVDKRGAFLEIFEREEGTLARIRKKYLEVFERLKDDNIIIIESVGAPEEVAEKVYAKVPEVK